MNNYREFCVRHNGIFYKTDGEIMKKQLYCLFALILLFAISGCDDDDDWFDEQTHLVVVNLSSSAANVQIDEDQDGGVRSLGIIQPGQTLKWEVDTGWAWLFIDSDVVEIWLDPDYDGWFEIRD